MMRIDLSEHLSDGVRADVRAAQVVVDDEARRAADEAEAARIMRNRRIAAILLSAE